MLKTMLLNKDNVIIDIVENCKPVKKNLNGLTVLCDEREAQGYIGSDETIYAKVGSQFISAYTDILSTVMIDEDEIPNEVEPLKYIYVQGKFEKNENPYPLNNMSLTIDTAKNSADIEYIAIMSEIDLEV